MTIYMWPDGAGGYKPLFRDFGDGPKIAKGPACCCGGSGGPPCDQYPNTLYFKVELWSDVGGPGEKMCCTKNFPIYKQGLADDPIWTNDVSWTDNLCDYVCYAEFQCLGTQSDYRLDVGSGCAGGSPPSGFDGLYATNAGLDWHQVFGTSPLDIYIDDAYGDMTGSGALFGTYQVSCPFPHDWRFFIRETPW